MSELLEPRVHRADLRWLLLATTSALALVTTISVAEAGEERPTLWIELGGQFENVTGKNDLFVPPFDAAVRAQSLPSVTEIENVLAKSLGGEGSLTFQPHGSDWIFSASARFGRTHTARNRHQEKILLAQYATPNGVPFAHPPIKDLPTPTVIGYVDQRADNFESHAIVDFQVGKDVGVGLLGHRTDTTISFGARYAQLIAKSDIRSNSVADAEFQITKLFLVSKYTYNAEKTHHNSASIAERQSNFHAIGPSVSFNNSTNLLGSREEGLLAVDWGANAAVLFGRQRANTNYQTITRELGPVTAKLGVATPYNVRHAHTATGQSVRNRNVVVPNLGGFAAVSYRFTNAKLSAGYRADFFFGAQDRGLDTRHSVTTGFYGPYANISIGLGG